MRSDHSEASSPSTSGHDEVGTERVRRAVRTHAAAVKRRELQRAVTELEAEGTLSPVQERVVVQMATAIVDGVLAAPTAALADAAESDDQIGRAAADLFDLDA